jgi:hypothetical protein
MAVTPKAVNDKKRNSSFRFFVLKKSISLFNPAARNLPGS